MSVNVDLAEVSFTNVVAGVVIDVGMKTFDVTHIQVYYGKGRLPAIQGMDYTIHLDGEPDWFFDITATPLLRTKIDAMLVAEPLEQDVIYVLRSLPLTTDFIETDAFSKKKISDEFDRTVMRFQQFSSMHANDIKRAIRAPLGEEFIPLPEAAARAGHFVSFDSFGNVILVPLPLDVTSILLNLPFVNVEDYGTNGAALAQAIETGETVFIPTSLAIASQTVPFAVPAGKEFIVMRGLNRIISTVVAKIKFAAGHFSITSGDIGRVGLTSANLWIEGADPIKTNLVRVISVTGEETTSVSTMPPFIVVYELGSVSGYEVGDFATLFNLRPTPLLSGDGSVFFGPRPIHGELDMPLINVGLMTGGTGGGSVSFTNYDAAHGMPVLNGVPPGTQSLSDVYSVNDMQHLKGQSRRVTSVEVLAQDTCGVAAPGWDNGDVKTRAHWRTLPSAGTIETIEILAGVVTISVSPNETTPSVITWPAHGMTAGDAFFLTTTGGLPTPGMSQNQMLFVRAANLTVNTFEYTFTVGGNAHNTFGTSQSGVHTGHQQRLKGTGTLFITQANVNDIILENGRAHRIANINSNTQLSMAAVSVTIAALTPYSVVTTASYHEGAHEITAVDIPNNRITCKVYSKCKPPINNVAGGEVHAIKTIFKNNGPGDGLYFEQNASLTWLNKMAIVGDFAQSFSFGLAMTGRMFPDPELVIFQGPTQLGTMTNVTTGSYFVTAGWGVNVFVGTGGAIQSWHSFNMAAKAFGVWGLERTALILRENIIAGNNNNGVQANAGSLTVLTASRTNGNGGDGFHCEIGATLYAEIPWTLGNRGMGYRISGGKAHLNEGVTACNHLSGIYADGGEIQVSRMFVAGNRRAGLELLDQSVALGDEVWITGTTRENGGGFGMYLSNSDFKGPDSGITGNELGVYLDNNSNLVTPTSYIKNNRSTDMYLQHASDAVLHGSDMNTMVIDHMSRAWVADITPPAIITGDFIALNVVGTRGSVVYDGLGSVATDTSIKQGRETMMLPASWWNPTLTNGCTRSIVELSAGNRWMSDTLNFSQAAIQYATIQVAMPKRWNEGTITYRYHWRSVSASGAPDNVLSMSLSGVSVGDNEALDVAGGTPVERTDIWENNARNHVSSESGAVTIAGTPAAGEILWLKLQRNTGVANNVLDTAYIEAVEIFWTSNAPNDT